MVSIVIACYNVEEYVEEAVRSAMNQTYKDLEIICVNDASTDNTSEILQHLASEDDRIKIINHKKNQGLVAVRSHGAEVAGGDYIVFLDGDDLFLPDIIEKALDCAILKNVDIVHFKTEIFPSDVISVEHYQSLMDYLRPYQGFVSHEEGSLVDLCFVQRKIPWNAWGKLLKTSVVKRALQFFSGEYINLGEDILLFFMCLIFAKGYAPLSIIGCRYRQASGMTKVVSKVSLDRIRRYAEEYQVYDLLYRWTENLGKHYKYSEALNEVKRIVVNDAKEALSRIDPQEKSAAYEIFNQFWPCKDFVYLLLYSADFAVNDLLKQAELLWDLRKEQFTTVKPRVVKTIGMFYYRLYNGGVERVVALLSKIFNDNGYKVVLFTNEEPNQMDYDLPTGVKRVVVPSAEEKSFLSIQKRMEAWENLIQKNMVDIVIYHAWCNLDLFYDELAIKLAGVPLILHTHGSACANLKDGNHDYMMQTLNQKKLYALCDVIVTLSSVDLAWWTSLGLRTVKTVNPTTFDITSIPTAQTAQNNILWVGRISDEKQPLEALKIMRYVNKKLPDAKLFMLGMADSEVCLQSVKAYIKENKMQNYVSLEGYQTNLKPYYQMARAVLWTAKHEGAPMAMVESKVFSLPIVAYDIANVDMIRERKGLYVVPQYDAQSAADHLINLLTNDRLYTKMCRDSQKSAECICNIDQMKQWQDVFKLSMLPKDPEQMNSQLPPLTTAVQMMIDYMVQGEMRRLNQPEEGGQIDLPSTLPTLTNRNAKWIVKKVVKYCVPTGIVELRQRSLIVAGGSKRWIIKNVLKAVLPWGLWRVKNIICQLRKNRKVC